jgi:hypothetical protein
MRFAVLPLIALSLGGALDVSAQTIGAFRWQLQPFCNVLTLSVRVDGTVYTLDGYDDQCGAAERAGVAGIAYLNADGSIGMGLSSLTVPGIEPLALTARLQLASLNGTWSDSAGNNGTFAFTPNDGTGGPPRSVPSGGIRPASITAEQIAPTVVGGDEIAAGAIASNHLEPSLVASLAPLTATQIGTGAVTAGHLVSGAVGSAQIVPGAVRGPEIAAGAVGAAHFAAGAASAALVPIPSAQIAPAAVLSAHIAPGAVTAAHIAAGSIGSTHFAAGAITSAHLPDGAITAEALAAGAVGASHFAPGVLSSLITGGCPVGQYMRGVAASGSPICEPFLPRAVTTTLEDAPPGDGWQPSMTLGADGMPVVAAGTSTPEYLIVTKCGNASCTAGNLSTIADATLGTGYLPAIAIGGDGLPIIAHLDARAEGLRITKCGDAGCTTGNTSTLADAHQLDLFVHGPSIAIGRDGLPIVANYNSGTRALRVTKCGNAACTAGNVSADVDDHSTNYRGLYLSMATGADGLPIIIHFEANSSGPAASRARVTKCGNLACTADNVNTTIDPMMTVGGYGAIAIAPDGLPLIAYHDATARALRVTRCGNPACSAENISTTVDDDAVVEVGIEPSIAFAIDGLPIISHSTSSGTLRVSTCGNPSCSAGNNTTTVDGPDPLVGGFTSIRIGADGLPVVVYQLEGFFIRVTKCGTRTCR